ncbi:C40 family peptidase [Streptomyces sp. PSKA54]|uniref:C40 family peptidase n=1 Tax=Streptomyces himalayensis subsp. aureolus TaxID=2758039 RepID=A0A7W2HDX0_9ACTN|nr:C40 family peptidase [Streptomyces himalayensis]MBA4860176.1 C40 family peptidase [Streptomyces himalayensis subsp. aureolus]
MGSHRRRAHSGLDRSGRGATVTVLSTAAATAAAALAAAPAGAAPRETPQDVGAEVDRLYEQAEKATEAYNTADERAESLRAQVKTAQDRIARGQERLNTMRGALGALAGAQYRSGGIDPALALVLSADPDGYLDKAATLDRVSARQADRLKDVQEAQRALAQERTEAAERLAQLELSRKEVARHKRSVEHKLAEARRLLNALPAAEREAYDRVSRDTGRIPLLDLSGSALPSSARAAAAVAAARSAIGLPYVWGANGPSGFDCSGLMQWSYAQAGVGLPRTSQAQRYAGRQVSLAEARPGDLVAYHSDASHIAMYVGNGQVVHAPYPGAPVRYDPVGMMPVSSVTRV